MTDEDLHMLSGAYALDALDPLEHARFERHLSTCATCTAEVAEFHATTARLAAAESMTPPASMRSDVLRRASQTRQNSPVIEPVRDVESSRSSTAWRSRVLGVAAGVLAVAMVGTGYIAVNQTQRADQLEQQSALVASVLSAPDARTVPAKQGEGSVVVSASQGRAVFVTDAAAEPAAGSTYSLWRIAPDGSISAAGLWEPGDGGTATVPLTVAVKPGDTVAVSIEPDGGSAQPTTDPIVVVPLSA